MTLSIMGLFVTVSINDIPHNGTQQTSIEFYITEFLDFLLYAECPYAECHYAECRGAKN